MDADQQDNEFSELSAEDLYTLFKKRYRDIKPAKIGGLKLDVFKGEVGDYKKLEEFYEENAEDLLMAHPNLKSNLHRDLEEGHTYIIRATLEEKEVGYLLLKPIFTGEKCLEDLSYHFLYPAVKGGEQGHRRKRVFFYMLLRGFLFMREHKGFPEVYGDMKKVAVVAVTDIYQPYESLEPLVRTWKAILKKRGNRLRERESERDLESLYIYERDILLYHIFEEILGLKLSEVKGSLCYVMELDSF